MGIAGFARRLDRHATRYSPEDLSGSNAVIDGPSLAYHAHKLALAAAVNKSNVSRIPSYADIAQQALRWLRALDAINIKVSTILFDGALPKTKQHERVTRNDRYNQQVNGLRSNYPSEACPIPTSLGPASYAFLAPALRETLGDSEYASITSTVPGEADDWCAPYANKHPKSVIFSDDTDLLLYDFPGEVRIIFFRDTDLWPEPKLKGYYPPRICQDLGLSNLGTFAYCLSQDPFKSETALIEEAQSVNRASGSYHNFIERYTTGFTTANPFDTQWANPSLQNLDVRTSEFVFQSLDSTPKPTIYLPFLVEDKHRASAWNIGQDLRAVAYSFVAAEQSNVQEHRRKAQKVTMHEIELYPLHDLPATVRTYTESIRVWLEWSTKRKVPGELVWPLYAIGMVLPELNTPPSFAQLLRILSGDFDNSWNFIHLTACLHAGLYSLRVVKQCVDVWLSLNNDSSSPLLDHAKQLQLGLQQIGSISELFLVPGQGKRALGDAEVVRELLVEIYASAKVEVPLERKSNKKAKKQQREAERKGRRKQETATQTDSNVFDVLAFMNAARKS
ncbi:hypothetical protein BU23DRAFT_91019 [Bimuria novae-zelandiae CBS 107.79]|uniref:Asteroid domain-containing protein n=1 Tax=Bimuria novae-zelandiae CBS 107.79 TaxID=1447943 RepID=A0A6A5VCB8_9PLEO|nr:hypothetical protein BU23DRAFT_91019 [Bimuria novae-zelandiae CBS 107.79]